MCIINRFFSYFTWEILFKEKSSPGPILESKGMHAIFQKKGKKSLKNVNKGQNI